MICSPAMYRSDQLELGTQAATGQAWSTRTHHIRVCLHSQEQIESCYSALVGSRTSAKHSHWLQQQ